MVGSRASEILDTVQTLSAARVTATDRTFRQNPKFVPSDDARSLGLEPVTGSFSRFVSTYFTAASLQTLISTTYE